MLQHWVPVCDAPTFRKNVCPLGAPPPGHYKAIKGRFASTQIARAINRPFHLVVADVAKHADNWQMNRGSSTIRVEAIHLNGIKAASGDGGLKKSEDGGYTPRIRRTQGSLSRCPSPQKQ